MGEAETPIVLYDGDCRLCASAVRFAIVRDRRGQIKYAAQQSEAGRRLLKAYGLDRSAAETFVLVERGKAYTHSTAALRLVRHLRGAWPLLTFFLIVPRPLRDALYAWVARNRHRWFGRRESCLLMLPEYRERFLS